MTASRCRRSYQVMVTRGDRHIPCDVIGSTLREKSVKYQLSSTAHLLTIDVAEWYRDPTVAAAIPESEGSALGDRSADVVPRMLDEFAETRSAGTFFVTASIAQRN